MHLYALRHGKAGEGYPDEIRELTGRGRDDVAEVVAMRSQELARVDLLLHSPLVRARQTAELVLQSLVVSPEVEESRLIRPGSSVETFCDYLSALDAKCVLICTHNPFVADLVSYLTGHLTAMSTAALAALEFDVPGAGRARLIWLETP